MAVDYAKMPRSFIENIDINDPEYIKQLLRPADIKEDLQLMNQRSRVSLVLRSPFFRRELEKIVASQMKDGCLTENISVLKQILDYLTPHAKLGSSHFTKGATMPVLPINDLKGAPLSNYVKGERLLRCKVASVYRLVDLFGWNSGIGYNITARVTKGVDEFLVKPLGLLFHEVSASSLMKVDLTGNLITTGTAGLGIDRQSWMLHSAIHEARPDVRCIVHLNTPATVAVSCAKSGLLPISQEAMILGETAVYDPSSVTSGLQDTEDGISLKEKRIMEERKAIAALLQSHSQDCMVLMIRSHGILAMGQTVEEAWFFAFTAILACEAQLRLSALSEDELVLPVKEAQQAAHYVGRTPVAAQLHPGENVGSVNWRRGELEFEALMRRLDSAGYRTGHVYRIAQIHSVAGASSTMNRPLEPIPDDIALTEPMTPRSAAALVRKTASLGRGFHGLKDVAIPPTASSFSSAYYDDDEKRAAAAAEAKMKSMSLSRTRWFNTPNVYTRADISEIGTPTPKMIAHWADQIDGAKHNTSGMAVPVEDPNQFAPQGVDPHEFKKRQRKIKENYYNDVKNAGPQSNILLGLDVDVDGSVSPPMSPTGTLLRPDLRATQQGHVVVVGAVSKGIINKSQRHNVGAFQSVYSPNPFDNMTDEDLTRYRENVDRKAKGLPSLEDEEAAAQVEEARKAAQLAKEAMEFAADQPHTYSSGVHGTPGLQDISHTGTSGADVSQDDAEKDPSKGADKKRKRRFKMPSFGRKSKPKSKE